MMRGVSRVNLNSYLQELGWRWNNTEARIESADKILEAIGEFFPAIDPVEQEPVQEFENLTLTDDFFDVIGFGRVKGKSGVQDMELQLFGNETTNEINVDEYIGN